jgi:cytochrome c peroxidase
MSRRFVTLGPVTVVLLLAGCGGAPSGNVPTTTAAPAQQQTTPTPPPATPSFPAQMFDYVAYAVTNLPQHIRTIPNADNTPANNPITNPGANLGRVLFYDKRLSANDTVSCASCHLQAAGFSDPEKLSRGFLGGHTARNSMGLSNARFYARGRFFWDERAATLEIQTLLPIQDSIEMGLTLQQMEAKLAGISIYPPLFQAAFGTPDVTADRVSRALSQFVRAMVTYQSKFDQAFALGVNGTPNFSAVFTPEELRGQALFGGGPGGLGCNRCHGTAAHISVLPENNGLDAVFTDAGAGRGRFKSPSLRNIEVTAPYMHDGRFATLEEVIEFYNSGVQDSPDLSPLMREGNLPTGAVRRLNLTPQQKADLKAFMLTLTDRTFLADPAFSNPF